MTLMGLLAGQLVIMSKTHTGDSHHLLCVSLQFLCNIRTQYFKMLRHSIDIYSKILFEEYHYGNGME